MSVSLDGPAGGAYGNTLRLKGRGLASDVFQLSSAILHPLSSRVRWNKITLVGVGLLGGSLGLAAKRRGLAREIAGYVRRDASVRECTDAGAVDYATTDLLAAVWKADLVVLCTPIAQIPLLVEQMLPALKRGAIVTDVGSVKASVVEQLESRVASAGAHFVGSHPMAGAEKTGVIAASEDLFEGAVCVVTPTPRTNAVALRKIQRFWKSVGSELMKLSPEVHDLLVSRSSHLPHVVAATLVSLVLDPSQPEQQDALCANGFRDTTRVASGSPEMWRDIALANRRYLRVALDDFVRQLQRVQALLREGNADHLTRFFETAKRRRDEWCSGTPSRSPE